MNELISYLTQNSATLLAALAAAYALATLIAKLTPTQTDNKILAKIGSFAARIGLDLNKRD